MQRSRQDARSRSRPKMGPRIGVVGAGYWGPNVARAFAALPECTGLAICDADTSRLDRLAAELPQARATTRFADLLADASIDAVAIATPAATHFSLAREALVAGKHVLVEKPLCASAADAEALARLAAERRLTLAVGHVYLYHPAVEALTSNVRERALGDVRYVTSQRASLGPRAREDVSVVWDYLIHDVYILQSILGEPESVRAAGGAYLRPGIADAVFAELRFGGGVIAHCQASWYYPEKTRRLTVVGSRAMATFDEGADPPLTIARRGFEPFDGTDEHGNRGLRLFDDGVTAPPLAAEQPLARECADFIRALRSGEEPRANAASAIAVIRTLAAIERALATGESIRPGAGERSMGREAAA